jgi:hypothetical protein
MKRNSFGYGGAIESDFWGPKLGFDKTLNLNLKYNKFIWKIIRKGQASSLWSSLVPNTHLSTLESLFPIINEKSYTNKPLQKPTLGLDNF